MENLKAIFPNIEPDIIQAVFLANNGNQDSTVAALLEMADPNQTPKVNTQDDEIVARKIAQLQEDEELARQLQSQDIIPFETQPETSISEELTKFGKSAKNSIMGFVQKVQSAFKPQDNATNRSPQYGNLPENDFEGFLDDESEQRLGNSTNIKK